MTSLPGVAMWLADDAIWHGKDTRACFRELGSMRVSITLDLWKILGLHHKFPNGWLLESQSIPLELSPPAYDDQQSGKKIIARTILPRTIQCTCDKDGMIVKQSVQEDHCKEKLQVDKAPDLFDEKILIETREKSTEIFSALRQLCQKRGILGIDGLRITWGITAEGNILTPIGGFGLPDHARYFSLDLGPNEILDRRFAKKHWATEIASRDARALNGRIPMLAKDLERRYIVCRTALVAQ